MGRRAGCARVHGPLCSWTVWLDGRSYSAGTAGQDDAGWRRQFRELAAEASSRAAALSRQQLFTEGDGRALL